MQTVISRGSVRLFVERLKVRLNVLLITNLIKKKIDVENISLIFTQLHVRRNQWM